MIGNRAYGRKLKFNVGMIYLFCLYVLSFGCVHHLRAQEYPKLRYGFPEDKQLPVTFIIPDTSKTLRLIRRATALQESNRDSAFLLFREAIIESRRLGYTEGVSIALQELGLFYGNQGDYYKSLRYFNQAYNYNNNGTRHSKLSADLNNNIGLAYYYLGNYEKAAYYYYNAINDYIISWNIKNIISDGTRSLALTYSNLSILFTSIQQYQRSLYYLELASRIAHYHSYQDVVAQVLINKGTVYVARNELDKALLSDLEALRKSKQANYRVAEYVANCGIGEILIRKNQPEKAIPYLETALKTNQKANLYYSSSMPVHLLGNAWFSMKDYKKAEKYVLMSLKNARERGHKTQIRDALETLAAIYKKTGNYKESLQYQEAYSFIKDSLLNEQMSRSVNQMEVQYRTAQKDQELIRQQTQLDRKNRWILIITAILSFSIVMLLLFFTHKQRLQRKKIQILEQDKEIRSLKAMMNGEEKERSRIARELHDGIGGMLAAIKMNFSSMQNKYKNISGTKDFSDIITMLDEAGREVHETAHNLMPDVLMRYGLFDAVRLYIENINASNQLHIDLQMNGLDPKTDKSFQLSVYRIIQELLQNVQKHAQATHILVQIIQNEEILTILVEDNGIGFNTAIDRPGLGLKNIHHRVQALHGSFSIQSDTGKGTLVYIEFDLQKTKSLLHL